MKNEKGRKEKIAFFCLLIASVCFYISAAIGIFGNNGSNWEVRLCLGSAFLCIALTRLYKGDDEKDE